MRLTDIPHIDRVDCWLQNSWPSIGNCWLIPCSDWLMLTTWQPLDIGCLKIRIIAHINQIDSRSGQDLFVTKDQKLVENFHPLKIITQAYRKLSWIPVLVLIKTKLHPSMLVRRKLMLFLMYFEILFLEILIILKPSRREQIIGRSFIIQVHCW